MMDKAKRSLKTAAKIFSDGEIDFAGSRAYYAMFYVAEALLCKKICLSQAIQQRPRVLEKNLRVQVNLIQNFISI